MALSEFTLPVPDNRVVVFGNIVFKLKYKMSPSSEGRYTVKLQNDLTRLTKGILRDLCTKHRAHPLRSDRIVLFPGVTSWVTGKTLLFTKYGKELAIYPDTVLLVVHVISPSVTTACKRPLEETDEQHLPMRKKKLLTKPDQETPNYHHSLEDIFSNRLQEY